MLPLVFHADGTVGLLIRLKCSAVWSRTLGNIEQMSELFNGFIRYGACDIIDF